MTINNSEVAPEGIKEASFLSLEFTSIIHKKETREIVMSISSVE